MSTLIAEQESLETKRSGIFVISLDFELYWGVRDKRTIEEYQQNLAGTSPAILALLKLFDECEIHATWATVGFLFFESREELINGLPASKPQYLNDKFSPYHCLHGLGGNETEAPFHYAPSMIKMIASFPHQEIGTHTFSHYYCLEKGQDLNTFRDDLDAAMRVARKRNLHLESLVFPKNQFNSEYIAVCKEMGVTAYRGNGSPPIYSAQCNEKQSFCRKGLRLLDSYFDISGHNSHDLDEINGHSPFNIPASRFLRPYSRRLKILEPLRLRRIQSELTYAAREKLVYHLWWHPHNFGVNLAENMSFLRKILEHYANLREVYGMKSLNMGEMAQLLLIRAQNNLIFLGSFLCYGYENP